MRRWSRQAAKIFILRQYDHVTIWMTKVTSLTNAASSIPLLNADLTYQREIVLLEWLLSLKTIDDAQECYCGNQIISRGFFSCPIRHICSIIGTMLFQWQHRNWPCCRQTRRTDALLGISGRHGGQARHKQLFRGRPWLHREWSNYKPLFRFQGFWLLRHYDSGTMCLHAVQEILRGSRGSSSEQQFSTWHRRWYSNLEWYFSVCTNG